MVLKEQLTGINVNLKNQIKRKTDIQNFLIDPSFQEVNRLFVLSFDNEEDRESYQTCYLPTVEIKS